MAIANNNNATDKYIADQNNATDLAVANIKNNNTGKEPLSEKEVKAWVDYLNGEVAVKYGTDFTALKETGINKYQKGNVDADFIIVKVLESDDLTDEQAKYLLINKFGITQDQINAAMKDPHYKR